MSKRLRQAFRKWWDGGPFSDAEDGTHGSVVAECAYRAGYLAASRDLAAKEERSRRACSKAEAAVASQLAVGGDAGERRACDALENAAALSRLLEAVGMIGPGEMVTRARKRRAG